ncbi:DUF1499 domain-containing protein [Oryzicola mucosus]|uniref:DUF1499 domain-containing protein n=1 Tax=Oryzicola mucosus TaxID=2767425 RepID=A0A8J6PXD8_9HYPH|nr:DUF1499 domain-containing protein [Oryzicola mucosus]MBD0415982.1 DUF1499 domain-containing protein [Oryzicola mucosus]
MAVAQRTFVEPKPPFSAALARATAFFALVLGITAVVAHRWFSLETEAFLWVLGLVPLLAALAILLAGLAFSLIWRLGGEGGRSVLAALLLGAIVLTPYGMAGYYFLTLPMLTNVTTDLESPPLMPLAAGDRTGAMSRVTEPTLGTALLQLNAYPDMTGRRYELPMEKTLELVDGLIRKKGWRARSRVPAAVPGQPVTLEATARTLILALLADVSVRVTDDGEATYVDMRSASRYGRHDLGDNAARIASFLADLDQDVAVKTGTADPQD